ncbi:MAG: DNA-directed RNA polymerase, partial [Promethearchaeota archaeon]
NAIFISMFNNIGVDTLYKELTLSHVVRIPPTKFGQDIDDAAFEILSEQFNGQILKNIGFIIVIVDVKEIGDGKLLHGDPGTYHHVTFSALCYSPELHEIIEGTVVEVVEFGAFIRLGPFDGLCHVSQITNDFIVFENMNQRFIGKDSNKILTVDDIVRGRIIAVSMGISRSGKLGITMRQPYLGKIEWIADELEAINKESGDSSSLEVED